MVRVRFSVSLGKEHAARIKATAARLGEDVSAFMSRAAMEVVHREERKLDVFAEMDAEIAAAEAGAQRLSAESARREPDDGISACGFAAADKAP